MGGRIIRAVPFYDARDGRSRIAALSQFAEPLSSQRVYLLESFAGGYRVSWESQELFPMGWSSLADWFGVEDVDGDLRHKIFFAEGSHGTGSGSDTFSVYVPERQEVLSIEVHETRDPYFREWIEPCPRLLESEYRKYLLALESRMHNLRVTTDLSQIEESSEVIWYKENGFLKTGHVRIKRFPGPPQYGASLIATHNDGNIIWYGYFKGPVIGHDKDRNEHFVIYGPETMYNWPTCFESNSTFLWFGTRGDGVFQYHKAAENLQQMPPGRLTNEVKDDSSVKLKDSNRIERCPGFDGGGGAHLRLPLVPAFVF